MPSIVVDQRRRLHWTEFGSTSPDARPIIFCTGAAMSGSFAFADAAAFGELNVRLIAIDRPGLGQSDPHPDKTFATWIEDCRALQLHQPRAIGFSQGAPFALALAHAGIVDAVAIVSGQDELAHPSMAALLHPDIAAMLTTLQNDPQGFFDWFSGMATAEGLHDLILRFSSDRDRAVYQDAAFDAAFRRSLQEGFHQGAAGYTRDLINAMSPWPFAVEEITAPVHLWYGLKDTSTTHSPDFGATLAKRLPNDTLIQDPQSGGSILWTRARDILTALTNQAVP